MAAAQRVTLSERLARNSAANAETGCIEWTASRRPDGYGQVRWGGRPRAVHRLAWNAIHGEIPVGLGVLHRCDNPACLNVEHLFLGTQADNMADKKVKGRATGLRGEANRRAKLTTNAVESIRASSLSELRLAAIYGVNRATIGRARRGESW